MAAARGQLLLHRLAFGATGAASLGCSALLFRDLTDFSQWIMKPKRSELMWTYQRRHGLMKATLAGVATNTLAYFAKPAVVPSPWVWAGLNATSLGLLFLGYLNPELMMRPRNSNALYVSICTAADILKLSERVIVTKYGNAPVTAFPESQIMRPHIARVAVDNRGVPAVIAYCALTGTGIVYETPDLPDGTPREIVPLTQLENNLVVIDKATGHIGHQINGLNETELLKAMGETDYDKVGRRPKTEELERLGVKPFTEVSSWRMTLGSFIRTYPADGRVFINDYKEFPSIKAPVKTMYDKLMDLIFWVAIAYHNTSKKPVFPTIDKYDERLPAKERVWGFNVGDDYVAVTEEFVKTGAKGVRNMLVGGVPIVAAWDDDAESLGIWLRPSDKPIGASVKVDGTVAGSDDVKMKRLNTVKNGLFWFAWQNFFPQTRVNPEE